MINLSGNIVRKLSIVLLISSIITFSCSDDEQEVVVPEIQTRTALVVNVNSNYRVNSREYILVTNRSNQVVGYEEIIPGMSKNIETDINIPTDLMNIHLIEHDEEKSSVSIKSYLNYTETSLNIRDTVRSRTGEFIRNVKMNIETKRDEGEYFVSLGDRFEVNDTRKKLDNDIFTLYDNSNVLFFYRWTSNSSPVFYYDYNFNPSGDIFDIEEANFRPLYEIPFFAVNKDPEEIPSKIRIYGRMKDRNGQPIRDVIFYEEQEFQQDWYNILLPNGLEGVDSILTYAEFESAEDNQVRHIFKGWANSSFVHPRKYDNSFYFTSTDPANIRLIPDNFYNAFTFRIKKVFNSYSLTWEVTTGDLSSNGSRYWDFPSIPTELQEILGTNMPADLNKPSIEGFQETVQGRLINYFGPVTYIYQREEPLSY